MKISRANRSVKAVYRGSERSGRNCSRAFARRSGFTSCGIICGLWARGLTPADYEEAERMHNLCRARGIAGSAIDFLICAMPQRWWDRHIFTTDCDFECFYGRVLELKLYAVA